MRKTHDREMPEGWHIIKSVLIDEIRTASNFDLCHRAADALFHARFIGERVAKESRQATQSASRKPTE